MGDALGYGEVKWSEVKKTQRINQFHPVALQFDQLLAGRHDFISRPLYPLIMQMRLLLLLFFFFFEKVYCVVIGFATLSSFTPGGSARWLCYCECGWWQNKQHGEKTFPFSLRVGIKTPRLFYAPFPPQDLFPQGIFPGHKQDRRYRHSEPADYSQLWFLIYFESLML